MCVCSVCVCCIMVFVVCYICCMHAGVILYIWDGGAITDPVCGVVDIDVVR